jgi:hypothetical protein
MKKLILSVLIVLFSLNMQAQKFERHEISVFYGRLSNMELYGYGIEQVSNLMAALTGLPKVHVVSTGAMGFSYFFRLSNMVSLGVMGSYMHYFDANMAPEKRTYYRYATALAGVKIYWYQKEWFRTYSMFAVGTLYREETVAKGFRVAGQLSLLGMEFGKRFCGFVDLGAGDMGVAYAGLRVKF